jgi:DNA-binding transcriptional regulator YiaG
MDKKRIVEPEKVKQMRANLGMTQTEMANLLYVSLRHYQSWESGQYDMPMAKYELLCLKSKMVNKKV